MAETFTCPNCAGNLQHDGGDHLTVQCPYCNSTVIVPENLRPHAHQQNFAPLLAQSQNLQRIIQHINNGQMDEAVQLYKSTYGVSQEDAVDGVRRLSAGLSLATSHIQISSANVTKAGGRAGCLITAVILIITGIIVASVVVPVLGGGAALWALLSSADKGDAPAVNIPSISTMVAEIPGGLVAESDTAVAPLFTIGERGINPNQFNDARALAVDGNGVIYVADRQSGRLQLFASDGTYQTTWPWDKEKYTDDLEIDRKGVLYAEQSGSLYRYDLTTGELLGEMAYTEDIAVSFGHLALTLNGELLAINSVRNTIVRFDQKGLVLQTISMETVPNALGFDNVAVDGLGNIYVVGTAKDVLGDRQDVIFKFTPEGQFASQFGSSGDEPGTFMGIVSSIAVDGRGRIYVGDFLGVQVFDNNGRYLDLLKMEGVARDLAFNDQGELLAISSQDKLYKFDVSQLGE